MQLSLQIISRREASVFACVADTICQPADEFPAVKETTAVGFYDQYMLHSPRQNRSLIRVLFMLFEIAPLLTGFRGRLRQLNGAKRAKFIDRIARSRLLPVKAIFKIIKSIAMTAYYSDDGVLKICGYDPEANIDRGRKLRRQERRP